MTNVSKVVNGFYIANTEREELRSKIISTFGMEAGELTDGMSTEQMTSVYNILSTGRVGLIDVQRNKKDLHVLEFITR